MKTLENKSITFTKQGVGHTTDTVTILKGVVDHVSSERGLSPSEMRERDKMFDKLEAANGTIEFEDAQAAKLKVLINTFPWAVRSKDIIALFDEIEKL